MSTNLPESNPKQSLPPLAQYKSRDQYRPIYGDYFVWSRWFTTWHGLVLDYDAVTDTVSIVMAGVPYLLFTMNQTELEKETIKITLSKIKEAPNGKYAIQHHDQTQNAIIWYV